jgi:DNA-binding protein H-NS
MNKHGLTIADIEGSRNGQKPHAKATGKRVGNGKAKPVTANGKLPAKYRNPKTGETWSGWARPPLWIKDVKDRSKFLIEDGAASTITLSKTVAKKTAGTGAVAHKGRRTGPQPAKYRDPKTGATWSGRGPAPAWLAGAKDRTKFLIDAVSTGDATQGRVKSKASKSKAAKANGALLPTKPSAKSSAVRKTAVARKAATPTAKKRAARKVPVRKSVAVKNATPGAQNSQAPESASAS